MALVTISGFPCAGKTTRARQLENHLSARLSQPDCPAHLVKAKVLVINDESLSLSKAVYDDGRAEKPARASLFSAVQRHLGPDCIVIVDAMNYIKGSRYQMYCQAREIQVRNCTIFVATSPERCREWNSNRPDDSRYSDVTLDNLISRFEEPSSSARWDSPLITVASDDVPLDSSSEGNFVSKEVEAIWQALTNSELKPPNLATQVVQTSSTSYLTILESTTSNVVSAVVSAQSLSPLSGPTPLLLPSTPASGGSELRITIDLRKPVSMPQLQRLKRQFVTMNKGAGGGLELARERVADLFAKYLESQLR
ncbi:Kti12p [Sporobolomyces salmoneus]|uniref:Kti12p n=1 Tax=Sporobolomyces salmoneus TaxID=183962 RepID=UPI00317112FE